MALQMELCPRQLQKAPLRVFRDDRRQVRGVQTFKAWALADRRNQIDAVYGTSGPEADSSTEVVSVKARGGKKKNDKNKCIITQIKCLFIATLNDLPYSTFGNAV